MNYFSHYLALTNHNNPYLTVGSILPDLLRDSKPDYSFLPLDSHAPEYQQHLAVGMQHHIDIDKHFHNATFFKEKTSLISKHIRNDETISVNRYTYFLAHILLELYIDKIFIKQMPNKLNQFYSLIEQTNNTEISVFFKKYLPKNDFELFTEKKALFLNRAYLYKYTEKGFIEKAVNSIATKVGIPSITLEDQEKINYHMEIFITPIIERELNIFFSELKARIL